MTAQAPFPLVDPQTERVLFSLARRERLARDTNDWAGLTAAYWPNSRVRVTWFDGSIEEFVDSSRASVRPGKVRGFHTIEPVRAEQVGDRAIVESRGQILLRPTIEGVECDLTSWCRFVSGFERRDGEWRMAFFDNIYVKDSVVPTMPGETLTPDLELLGRGRVSYRWLSYTNERRGFPVPADLPGDDRGDLVDSFWARTREWLARR